MGSLIKVQDFQDGLSDCCDILLPVFFVSGNPIQIQTFLVETNTTVLCREGVCVSENEEKCPVDFFENDCIENKDYCGLTTHRGKWMPLFCKKPCHCLEATDDECCVSDAATQTQQTNLIEDHSEDTTEETEGST